MRRALLATLFGIGLLVLGLRGQSTTHHDRRAPSSGQERPVGAPLVWTETVVGGWNGSIHEARRMALEAARIEVIAFLRRQDPPIEWTPSTDYVQTHLVNPNWHEESQSIQDDNGEDLGTAYQYRLQVEITPRAYQEMQAFGEEVRIQNRMIGLGKILLALMVLLGVVSGYLRLDERTKGYYTGWLRFAAAGLVGVTVVGLLLLA